MGLAQTPLTLFSSSLSRLVKEKENSQHSTLALSRATAEFRGRTEGVTAPPRAVPPALLRREHPARGIHTDRPEIEKQRLRHEPDVQVPVGDLTPARHDERIQRSSSSFHSSLARRSASAPEATTVAVDTQQSLSMHFTIFQHT